MGITRFPHGISSFGVPLHGMSGGAPILGTVYYVDGTNGLDGNTGLEPTEAFKTIQRAITVQIADTTSKGDAIYVMPGTYAETVYAPTMNNVQLIGSGVSAGAVIVAPTDGHALLIGVDGSQQATMENSAVRNMTFRAPSTSNTEYAAMLVALMHRSVIEDCDFEGTTTTVSDPWGSVQVGLQIGNRTETTWELNECGRISRCKFNTNAGRTKELGVGISIGAMDDTGAPEVRGFKNMVIEDCTITAKVAGIMLWVGAANCDGSIIRRNHIHSNQGGVGPTWGIWSKAGDGTDMLCSIHDNRINALQDCIRNFGAMNTMGNIVSLAGAAVVGELPTT